MLLKLVAAELAVLLKLVAADPAVSRAVARAPCVELKTPPVVSLIAGVGFTVLSNSSSNADFCSTAAGSPAASRGTPAMASDLRTRSGTVEVGDVSFVLYDGVDCVSCEAYDGVEVVACEIVLAAEL